MWLGVNSPLVPKWPDHFRRIVALARGRAHALAHAIDRKKTPTAERRPSNAEFSEETAPPFDSGF